MAPSHISHTNGTPPPAQYADFLAFLESQHAELVRAAADDPALAELPEAERVPSVEHALDGLTAPLRDPSASSAWAATFLATSAGADQQRLAHAVLDAVRRQLLNAALRATVAGVQGTAESIDALMQQVDDAQHTIAATFVMRRDTELRIFRELFEHAPDSIFVTDMNGTVVHANNTFRSTSGFGDRVIGMNILDLGMPDLTLVDLLQESLMTNGSWKGVIPFQRPDGSSATSHSTVFLIKDANGAPHSVATISRDLSYQLQRESELRGINDRLEQSLATTPLATIEWDSQGIIRRWNPAAERIFGWSATEAIGKNIITLLVPDVAPDEVQTVVDGLLSGEISSTSRTENMTKDGRLITCQWYSAILRDEDGKVIGALTQAEDVTEDLRAEETLRRSQEQLIQAQQAALRELSTPLIPLADGVVAMPLIGSIDTGRAQLVIETLLSGVSQNHARVAILDITGVPVVDTQVANALIRAAQAVKLLGAQVILTGIRPEVAQTLVGLGVDLSGIVTRSSLQDGITYALRT